MKASLSFFAHAVPWPPQVGSETTDRPFSASLPANAEYAAIGRCAYLTDMIFASLLSAEESPTARLTLSFSSSHLCSGVSQ
jgi:hypothetical protein